MAHLKSFRAGWENEHLAEFLLSRIAFVSQPVTVGDDIGSDFFCTLFESVKVDKSDQLFPRNSFAIQIKSSEPKELALNGKESYLNEMEIPFFLGFVNQEELKLSIYSGEHLPMFFSSVGVSPKLKLIPVESLSAGEMYNHLQSAREHPENRDFIKLPLVEKLTASSPREEVEAVSSRLAKLCSRIQLNIAAKFSQEHVYQLNEEIINFVAGPGSALVFRKNLCLRLGEAFANLKWLYENNSSSFRKEEFAIYEKCYLQLIDLKMAEAKLTGICYEHAKKLYKGDAGPSSLPGN
jgi:hypothetical protein